jgi:hypothetical protein
VLAAAEDTGPVARTAAAAIPAERRASVRRLTGSTGWVSFGGP